MEREAEHTAGELALPDSERNVAYLKRSEHALRRQNEYLTALHETALGLIDRIDREELLEVIIERAAMLAETPHGYIYLLKPGDDCMQMRVGRGFFKSQLGRRVRLGEGIGGTVWQTGRPLVVDDYRAWSGRVPDRSLDQLLSAVGIPLKSNGEMLGVIGLGRLEERRPFGQEDVFILSRFAELALLALDKAKLYSEVRRELAERRRTEAILRESEARYRSLLESSPDPIVVYDMQGVATYINPAFEKTFGLPRNEILGKQIDFVPEEAWPETREAIGRMLKGKTINLFETRRKTKDGRVLDVQISSTLYRDRHGQQAGNIVILRDISPQKRTELQLRNYRDHLEDLVKERTAELWKANQQLKQEVDDRKRAEEALRRRERELKAQSHHLEEVNTALKVLLKQREEDKKELEESVLSNVKELISPYIDRMKKGRLSTNQSTLLQIVDTNLGNIVSSFNSRLSSRLFNLTPMEVRVANLVREGKTNKEIADILCVSKNTILFHRYNVRKKLGIKNQKINLRTHLMSYDD